jgi:alpha-galactosidase
VDSGIQAFADVGSPDGLASWVPERFISDHMHGPVFWRLTSDANFLRGEATRTLPGGLRVTWVAELAKEGSLFRLHVRMKNIGKEAMDIEWFPAWVVTLDLGGGNTYARWWRALSFKHGEDVLKTVDRVKLGSRLHSSDDEENGANPYWLVGGNNGQIYFGVEWCGGWEAKIRDAGGNASISVRLPQDETQLVLAPGDLIDGPAVLVVPTREQDDISNRRSWMSQRLGLAQSLYPGPSPSFPLTYNHWYSIQFDVDSAFLRRQIGAMDPYGFDAFIVDAGWYEKVGEWNPAATKFQDGEFEEILLDISARGVTPGLWSCPQFISTTEEVLPEELDDPPHFEPFIGGYSLDLANSDFSSILQGHVGELRERYSIGWWKYDQPLFREESRGGAMKNVVAYQDALRNVRKANPDLSIEGCLNGGRMINELTQLLTQTMWIRDGSKKGLAHARQNLEVGLGALEFMFPWSVSRWTSNLDDLDPEDVELTKLYCRSAMMGVWGISSDLSRIGEDQQRIIVKEIQRYRLLNAIKQDFLYEVRPPENGAETAGVTYYSADQRKAGVLLYRYDREGAFTPKVRFWNLQPATTYQVRDVDLGTKTRMTGKNLMKKGVSVSFSSERQSAMLFLDPMP